MPHSTQWPQSGSVALLALGEQRDRAPVELGRRACHDPRARPRQGLCSRQSSSTSTICRAGPRGADTLLKLLPCRLPCVTVSYTFTNNTTVAATCNIGKLVTDLLRDSGALTRSIRRRSGKAKAEVLALPAQTGKLLEQTIREARKLAATARPSRARPRRSCAAPGCAQARGARRSLREGTEQGHVGRSGVTSVSGRPTAEEGSATVAPNSSAVQAVRRMETPRWPKFRA